MTTMTLTARPVETRLRPLYATAFILGALLSACVAHYASLRLEYFLTIPFTCCAFFRAGSSSVVSTIGYGVFIPAALGFGLTAQSHGIFEASVFVVGALIVMCATLSMIVVKRQ
jgi:hypothetical protein